MRSIEFRERPMTRFTGVYGAHPARLLVLLACLALAGYAGPFPGNPALLTI
jgi:hypothetical protein